MRLMSVRKDLKKLKIKFRTSKVKTKVCQPILIKQNKCSRNATKKFKSRRISLRTLVKNTGRRSKPDNYNRWESARLNSWRGLNNRLERCLKVIWVSFLEICLYTPQRCKLSTIQHLLNPNLQLRDMSLWFLTCLISIQRTCLRQPKPKISNSRRSRLTKILMHNGNQGTLDWSQIIFSRHRQLSTRNKIKSKEI